MGRMAWWRENVVRRSSPESRRAGKISVFACAETILAVTAALWFAELTGIWTQVLISLAIAPLVLLRSDPSVETAYRWFQHDRSDGKPPSARALWAIAALSAAVSGAATYGLALWLLADTEGLRTFWIGFGLGVLALNLGVAVLMFPGFFLGSKRRLAALLDA